MISLRFVGSVFVAILSFILLSGCASGPKFSSLTGDFPNLKPGDGRIYFYRSSLFGFLNSPTIYINGTAVGESKASGFFFVDRKPGKYEVVVPGEVDGKLSIKIEADRELFIRISVGMGFLSGRPKVELVDTAEGRSQIKELSYTGNEDLKK